jgi:hypothetical protein
MARGARIVVFSTRPQAWDPFVRGAATPGASITVMPPNRFDIPAGSPLHPTLTIVDTGPANTRGGNTQPHNGAGAEPDDRWQTTLIVRDEILAADLDSVAQADLLVLQVLDPAEAALLGGALHLGDAADYLTRMRPDMIALVDRSAVRWAALAQTQIEAALIGDARRSTTGI